MAGLWGVLAQLCAISLGLSVAQEAPPRIAFSTASKSIREGDPLLLECRAEGRGPVEFSWWLGEREVAGWRSVGSFELLAARRSDAGPYRCRARNAAGTVLGPLANLTVAYLGEVGREGPVGRDVAASVGGFFLLHPPAVDGQPGRSLRWKWFHGASAVYANASHFVSAHGDLVVVGVARAHQGAYHVEVSHDDFPGLQRRSQDYHVSVSDGSGRGGPEQDPGIVLGPRNEDYVAGSGSGRLAVECVAYSRDPGGVEMEWRLNGSKVVADGVAYDVEASGRRLLLLNPDPRRHGGVYSCQARRGLAASPQREAWLTIHAAPRLRAPLPQVTDAALGSQVELLCQADGSPVPRASWYRDAEELDVLVSAPDPALSVGRDGSLLIRSMEADLAGVYQCVQENKAGAALATTWLRGSSSGPLISQKPENTSVAAGGSAILDCAADGAPPPKVTWLLSGVGEVVPDDVNYRLQGSSLFLPSATPSMSGWYTCRAQNDQGTSEARAFLSVAGRTQILNGPIDQSVVIGSNVLFPCEVSREASRDRFSRSWSYNGQLIRAGQRRMEVQADGGLFIRQVGPANVGRYECSVTSPLGTQTESALLSIVEKPSMPLNVQATLLNDSLPARIRVSWTEGFNGNSPIIKYEVQQRILGLRELWSDWESAAEGSAGEGRGAPASVVVDNLRPSSVYQFRVVAVNRFGPGKPSQPSNQVVMPQQPPAAAPRNVAGSARSPSSIMLQWQPPPPDQWNGDILGYNLRYRLANYPNIPWITRNVSESRARNILLEDLITWREYEVQVSAYNDEGMGVYSKSQYITTQEGVPTEAPSNVDVTVLNSTAAEVAFTPPPQQMIPGVNLGYKVEAWRGPVGVGQPAKELRVLPLSVARVDALLRGLRKYTAYNVTVLCYTGPGNGPRSKPQEVRTKQDKPGPVRNMRFADVLFSSVKVVWEPPEEPNGRLTNYTLEYWVTNQTDTRAKFVVDAGKDTSQVVAGLSASTHYTFSLFATTERGQGPVSTSTMESGVPPELPHAPASLVVSNVQADRVNLQFVPGFDGKTIITQWIVEGQVGSATAWTRVFNASKPQARSLVVSGLRPYTSYRLRLVAENVVGRSPPSGATKRFQTLQAPPSTAPSHLSAQPSSPTSLAVSWTPLPSQAWNGVPRGYILLFRKNETETRKLPGRPHSATDAAFASLEPEPWKERVVTEPAESEIRLEGLDPYSVFDLSVLALNDLARSEASAVVSGKTYEGVPASPPDSVSVSAETARAGRVSWAAVPWHSWNGRVLGYRLKWTSSESGEEESFEEEVLGEGRRDFLISKLRPYTMYTVTVAAFTVVGTGPASAPLRLQTFEDLPGPPSEIKFAYVSLERVRISWRPPYQPNGLIKRYQVAHWRNNSSPSTAVKSQVGRELQFFAASGLQSQTVYAFSVTAETSVGWGDEAVVYVYTTGSKVPPPAPSRPRADPSVERGPQSLGVAWDAPDTYSAPLRLVDLEYQRVNVGEWVRWGRRLPAAAKKAAVTGLLPNTAYRFRIKAENDFGQSEWSPDSEWIKTLPAPPSAPPSAIQAVPYDSSSIKIQWAGPAAESWNGDFLGVRLLYKDYDGGVNASLAAQELPMASGKDLPTEFVLSDLRRFRHYLVQLQSFNQQGSSPLSAPVFVYVGFSVPKSPVSGLKATTKSSTQIELNWERWSEGNEPISGFKVAYAVAEAGQEPQWTEDIAKSHESRAQLSELRKFTPYMFRVTPFNKAGEGPGAAAEARTLEDSPGPTSKLRFSDILLDSVNVSWDAPSEPNGRIIGYKVQYETYKVEIEYVKKIQEKVSRQFLRATNLDTNVTYTFSVAAETSKGYGPTVTGSVTIGPQPGSPQPPANLRVFPSDSYVTLEWDNRAPGSSPISGHIIQVKRLGKAPTEPLDDAVLTPDGLEGPEKSREKRQSSGPQHPVGEWVVAASVSSPTTRHSLSYVELEKASLYRFRVFARNAQGVSFPSGESAEVAVPEEVLEPWYLKWWFLVILALVSLLIIILIVALLCLTGRNSAKRQSVNSLRLADGGVVTYEMRASQRNSKSRRVPLSRAEAISGWEQGTLPSISHGRLASPPSLYSHDGGSQLSGPPPTYSNVHRQNGSAQGSVSAARLQNQARLGPSGNLYDSLAQGTTVPQTGPMGLPMGPASSSRQPVGASRSHTEHSLYTEKTDLETETESSGTTEESEEDKDVSSIVQHYQTSDVAYRETWRRAKEGAVQPAAQPSSFRPPDHQRPPSIGSSVASQPLHSHHQPHSHPNPSLHQPPTTPGSRAPIPGFSSFV